MVCLYMHEVCLVLNVLPFFFLSQEEVPPSAGQTAPESDADSGMGSPAEGPLTEAPGHQSEEPQGEDAVKNTMIQPAISVCNYRLVTLM